MKEKTIQKLLDLKETIETAKHDHAVASGSLKQLMQRLEDEFGIKSLDKAQIKLKKLQQEQEEIEQEIEETVEQLEKNYSW